MHILWRPHFCRSGPSALVETVGVYFHYPFLLMIHPLNIRWQFSLEERWGRITWTKHQPLCSHVDSIVDFSMIKLSKYLNQLFQLAINSHESLLEFCRELTRIRQSPSTCTRWVCSSLQSFSPFYNAMSSASKGEETFVPSVYAMTSSLLSLQKMPPLPASNVKGFNAPSKLSL